MKIKMKIKDLIEMNIDIDIYDNETQEVVDIGFVGPIKLTEEGENKFKEVLEYKVTLDKEHNWASINCTDEEPQISWLTKAKKAQELFYSLAGYCSAEDYDKWFKEVNL